MENYWYAITIGDDDNDWGTDSTSYEAARARAQELADLYLDTLVYIVTIDDGPDPIAVDRERIEPTGEEVG